MDNKTMPGNVPLSEGLGPLPEADGTAEANKERRPEGGYTYDEIPAWSEPLVRAYAAAAVTAERKRWIALAKSCAGYEASAAAHHAGTWQTAYEWHLTRHTAMCDLIAALEA